MTDTDIITAYAAAVQETEDAQHAYCAQPDSDTLLRFMRARQRYFTLTQEVERRIKLSFALNAPEGDGTDA